MKSSRTLQAVAAHTIARAAYGCECTHNRKGLCAGQRSVHDYHVRAAHLLEAVRRSFRGAASAAEHCDGPAAGSGCCGCPTATRHQSRFKLVFDPEPVGIVPVQLAVRLLSDRVHGADTLRRVAENVHEWHNSLLIRPHRGSVRCDVHQKSRA